MEYIMITIISLMTIASFSLFIKIINILLSIPFNNTWHGKITKLSIKAVIIVIIMLTSPFYPIDYYIFISLVLASFCHFIITGFQLSKLI